MTGYMFDFVTATCNPLAGGPCPYECSYCWATAMKRRFSHDKYKGPWRIDTNHHAKIFDAEAFPFACDMQDIGNPDIPPKVLFEVFRWVGSQPCPVLLLTKNPDIYRIRRTWIPVNAVLGATVECDNPALLLKHSKAPNPWRRLDAMHWCTHNLPNKRLICIEPIMTFTALFADKIRDTEPWAVAVGYDNHRNKLPEPPHAETMKLIYQLEEFTTVYRKTIRRAWDEK